MIVDKMHPKNPTEVRDLMYRFLSDDLSGPYEWDDFVVVDSKYPEVEALRKKIEEIQHLLFSKRKEDYEMYIDGVRQIAESIYITPSGQDLPDVLNG